MIKSIVKKLLPQTTRLKLRRGLKRSARGVEEQIIATRALFSGDILEELGIFYKTDKVKGHSYAAPYTFHFKKYRKKKIKLLEIGVGGFEDSTVGGHSLRMWKRYFPLAQIFSIDIHDKSELQETRIKIFQGSQVDKAFLNNVLIQTGELDIIIDDGSHFNEHVIGSFHILFPRLKNGGLYVIEDTQTSYWKSYGGDSENLKNPLTIMNFFKELTDCLNHKEFIKPDYQPTYYDQKILSIHFYHNLIFIYKGDNKEESNLVINNERFK